MHKIVGEYGAASFVAAGTVAGLHLFQATPSWTLVGVLIFIGIVARLMSRFMKDSP